MKFSFSVPPQDIELIQVKVLKHQTAVIKIVVFLIVFKSVSHLPTAEH